MPGESIALRNSQHDDEVRGTVPEHGLTSNPRGVRKSPEVVLGSLAHVMMLTCDRKYA